MLSKAQILDHVWQYDFGGDGGVVETYIGYLRRKLDITEPEADHHDPRRRLHDPHPDVSRAAAVAARPAAGRPRRRRRRARRRGVRRHVDDRGLPRRAGRRAAAVAADRVGRRPFGRPAAAASRAAAVPADRPAPSDFYVGDIDADGTLDRSYADAASPASTAAARRRRSAAAATDARSGEPFTVGAVDSDVRYRVVARRTDDGGGIDLTALPLTDVDDTVDRLVLVEVVATAIIVAVLAAVAWWVMRLGIRPIKQMTDAAQQIAAGDRSHRVPELAPSTEAGQLGGALNQMLDELDESFEPAGRVRGPPAPVRRRRVARAAHAGHDDPRLRRAVPRSVGCRDGDGLDEAMRRTEQEAVRMARLVDDLLTLAKLDEGRPLERRAGRPRRARRRRRPRRRRRRRRAGRSRPSCRRRRARRRRRRRGPPAPGHRQRRRQRPRAHAARHADRAARRRAATDRARIAVVDHGPGMPPDVAAKVTQRFYRADPARARHRGGSGLGMSIADAAVAAHGGTIAVDSAEGVGTTVTVTLPLAARARSCGAPAAADGTSGGSRCQHRAIRARRPR